MKREPRREHNPVQGASDGALQKAGSLAPPEERANKPGKANSNNGGVVEVDTAELKLPSDLTDAEDKKSGLFGLEPLAIIILIFAIAFIAYITYLISAEPVKINPEPDRTIENQR